MKRPNPQKQCDDWNARYGIGCKVSLKKDGGEVIETTTRSQAQVMCGHSAVIWLDGVSGSYLLDRVKAVPLVTESTH